jgi:tetratricopeptide (TPR) repeat protein/DNA-binding CsgD family transcriptional regulator
VNDSLESSASIPFGMLPRIFLIFLCLVVFITGKAQTPVTAIAYAQLDELALQYPDSAFIILREQLLIYQTNKYREGEAVCLQKMGKVLYHMGSYSQAMFNLLQSEKIFRDLKAKETLAENLNILGTVYYYNRQPAEALLQFNEALEIYSGLKNFSGLSATYANIGHLYEKDKRFDSALFFQRMAMQYGLINNNQKELAKVYENLGSIYEDKEIYDSARYYFELSLTLYKKINSLIDQVEVVNNLGDVYSKSGDFRMGLVLGKEAMELALQTHEKYQLQSAYRDIGENYFALGMADSAYIFLEKSRELVQEIYTADNQKQIALMQTLYESERKNNEITRLHSGRKIANTITFSVIAFLILLGLLGFVVYSREKLKLQNEKASNEHNQQIFLTQKELMESELKLKLWEEDNLKQQLEIRSQELSSHILHLIQKNEVMEEIRSGLAEVIKDDKRDQKKQLRLLLNKINFSFSQDDYWNEFRIIFDKVHESFFQNLKKICPELTASEIRLLALVKMNLNSADTAKLLGITQDSLRVIRYRVKKKMNLAVDDSLQKFVQQL